MHSWYTSIMLPYTFGKKKLGGHIASSIFHLPSSITSAFSEVAVSSHSFRRAVTALHSTTACRQNSVHDRSFSFSSPTSTGQDDDDDDADDDGDARASTTGMPSKRAYHSDDRRTVATREPNPCNQRGFGALQMKHGTSTPDVCTARLTKLGIKHSIGRTHS